MRRFRDGYNTRFREKFGKASSTAAVESTKPVKIDEMIEEEVRPEVKKIEQNFAKMADKKHQDAIPK